MKKYQKVMTSLAVTTALLGTTSWMTVQAAPAQSVNWTAKDPVVSLKEVDSKIVQAAQKELQNITGKIYTFSKVVPLGIGDWLLEVQGMENSQVMVKKDGEVKDVSIKVKWGDLKDSFKQEMNTALHQAFPGSNPQVDAVHISVQYGHFPTNSPIKSGVVYMAAMVDKTSIILENGKLHRIFKSLTNEEGLKKEPLNALSSVTKNSKEVNNITVNMAEGTDKSTSVNASNPRDFEAMHTKLKEYSETQLLENATVPAKQLYNIDLKEYKVSKDPNLIGVVHFTKKGAPSLIGNYDSNGQFFTLGLDFS